jgi:ATP adenylyltransferase/5',5'''-P-1,P-4-tetraphosphate phosphorylase II
VITKEPDTQTDKLTIDDFKACLIAMKSVEGDSLFYFNCGKEAGAQENHKHIGLMQVKHLPSKRIPI